MYFIGFSIVDPFKYAFLMISINPLSKEYGSESERERVRAKAIEKDGLEIKRNKNGILYDAMIVNTHVHVDIHSQGLF